MLCVGQYIHTSFKNGVLENYQRPYLPLICVNATINKNVHSHICAAEKHIYVFLLVYERAPPSEKSFKSTPYDHYMYHCQIYVLLRVRLWLCRVNQTSDAS